jgi:hypothetical protein
MTMQFTILMLCAVLTIRSQPNFIAVLAATQPDNNHLPHLRTPLMLAMLSPSHLWIGIDVRPPILPFSFPHDLHVTVLNMVEQLLHDAKYVPSGTGTGLRNPSAVPAAPTGLCRLPPHA